MKTFPLTISSPDGDLFRGEAEMLILRGTEGDLAVMAGACAFRDGREAGELRGYQRGRPADGGRH